MNSFVPKSAEDSNSRSEGLTIWISILLVPGIVLTIMHYIGVFIALDLLLLRLILWFLMAIAIIGSTIFLTKHAKNSFFAALLPIMGNLLVLLFMFSLSLRGLSLTPTEDFRRHLKQREKVVTMIETGRLKADAKNSRQIILPIGYRHLSKWPGASVASLK